MNRYQVNMSSRYIFIEQLKDCILLICNLISFQKTRSDKEINTLTNKIKKLESLCRALQKQGRAPSLPLSDAGMILVPLENLWPPL